MHEKVVLRSLCASAVALLVLSAAPGVIVGQSDAAARPRSHSNATNNKADTGQSANPADAAQEQKKHLAGVKYEDKTAQPNQNPEDAAKVRSHSNTANNKNGVDASRGNKVDSLTVKQSKSNARTAATVGQKNGSEPADASRNKVEGLTIKQKSGSGATDKTQGVPLRGAIRGKSHAAEKSQGKTAAKPASSPQP